jgi:lipoprotein NlpI
MGNFAAARANFEQAIQLGTNDISGLIGLGCLQADQLQFAAALENFRTAEKLDPSWVYAWYHIYLIRVRLGQDKAAQAELSDHMKSAGVTDNDWSSKIGNYLAGNLPKNDLLKIASDSSINMAMRQEQLCEAYYYAGMQNLLAGDKNKAADLFRKCLNTNERDFMEYAGAEAELTRLKN